MHNEAAVAVGRRLPPQRDMNGPFWRCFEHDRDHIPKTGQNMIMIITMKKHYQLHGSIFADVKLCMTRPHFLRHLPSAPEISFHNDWNWKPNPQMPPKTRAAPGKPKGVNSKMAKDHSGMFRRHMCTCWRSCQSQLVEPSWQPDLGTTRITQ